MTDVRLTALNPTDSQVYPVACNTSGELLVADGGGGGGDYLPLTGGELTGPLTSTSSITAAGDVSAKNARLTGFVSTNIASGSNTALSVEVGGVQNAKIFGDGTTYIGGTLPASPNITLSENGSATFAGNAQIGAWDSVAADTQGAYIYSVGSFQANRTSSGGSVFVGRLDGAVTSELRADGEATFGS
jgi:hypothetical protein